MSIRILLSLVCVTMATACASSADHPPTPDTPMPAGAAIGWLHPVRTCVEDAGYRIDQVSAAEDGAVLLRMRQPVAPFASDAKAWRSLTPAPSADTPIEVTLRPMPVASDPLRAVLVRFSGTRFVDVQRWRLAMARCETAPALGAALFTIVKKGRAGRFETMAASVLIHALCQSAGSRCPKKYTHKVLAIARQFRGPAAEIAAPCGSVGSRPIEATLLTDYRAWVLAVIAPPAGMSEPAWWRKLDQAGLLAAPWQVETRFAALGRDGKWREAAVLVDTALDARIRVGEALRFRAAQAYQEIGERALARARFESLASRGRTVFATFARRALATDTVDEVTVPN